MWNQIWSCSWRRTRFGSKWLFSQPATSRSSLLTLSLWQDSLWCSFFQRKCTRSRDFPRITSHARVNVLWKTAKCKFFIWWKLKWMNYLISSFSFIFRPVRLEVQGKGFCLQEASCQFTCQNSIISFPLMQVILKSRSMLSRGSSVVWGQNSLYFSDTK